MAPPRRPPGVVSTPSRLASLFAIALVAACFATGSASAGEGARPLIVEGRILWQEGAEPGDPLGFEVQSLQSGFVGASILEVVLPAGEDGCGGESRAALDAARELGWALELVLHEAPHGRWAIECARRSSTEAAAGFTDRESHPPPLVAPTVEAEAPVDRRLRVGSAVSTPTFEQEVVRLVNVLRQDNGNLPPLKQQSNLDTSAETHSQNMASRNFFAHCDVDTGKSPWTRMNEAGYSYYGAAENIAAGSSTPSGVLSQWANSSGHRANMLATHLHELGVGYAYDPGDTSNVRRDLNGDCVVDSTGNGPYYHYWTQNFGWRNGVFPVVIEREAHSTTTTTVSLYLYGTYVQYVGGQNPWQVLGWAQDMRFSNDGVHWSGWEPYNPNKTWSLAPGNGIRTVWAQVRNGAQSYTSSDTIELDGNCSVTTIEDDVLTGTQSFADCEIHAGPSLEVVGTVTFRADRTVLRSGFSVGAGGRLTIAPPS